MSGGDGGDRRDDAPVDFELLATVRDRLVTDERFQRVTLRPEGAPDRLRCVFSDDFYPPTVERARIELVWYENGDFSIHYHETHAAGAFDHRWDRHPSDHNSRDHVHPGPDAPTPGRDESHPSHWRDTLTAVFEEIDERQRALWR